ncbi:toprim domain-containing protein [Asticcacaulis sp. BYS171W]|uniref:Toprim domain-containing protein n=1 Tax=Asticcacaulis aquaticus TaxID=2984212 RepID=A0ABT5HTP6_9CAUL|nr:toprim domain-containing protein [Asticcacaulis aquaticus]MDC7683240.1 toprim domain-containing protein [Asticcacaulis aquaticus]
MRDDIIEEVTQRLKADYGFKENGKYLQQGRCPDCKKRELWASALNPSILHCQRGNQCGRDFDIKDLYPEIFDTWSSRYQRTDKEPDAAADAYLSGARGLRIGRLKGSYSQDLYQDPYKKDLISATVRFPLPGGSYWERLIDQPGRFGKRKANFKKGGSHGGFAWMAPDQPIEVLAKAQRIWICEGIFDAASWQQIGEHAVSCMSTSTYPEHWLKALRKACADLDLPQPELIFAFDTGKSGEESARKFVDRAREEGWTATAAMPRAEGEVGKRDWNDLLRRNLLRPEDIEQYLWYGKILLAADAHEKAVLLWEKHEWSSFSFVFQSRTWWASFDQAKINEAIEKESISRKSAARRCCNVSEIANCAFRILYSQYNKALDERTFYMSITTPWAKEPYGARFTPAALTASSEFKKVLLGAGNGAHWTGSGFQLDKLLAPQYVNLKTVETLDFTGYSKEHGVYVFGDIAVQNGRVIDINREDYFDCGNALLKLKTTDRICEIEYDAEKFDTSWVDTIYRAYGCHGIVALSFAVASMFAEQIRAFQKSFLFLECSGLPGTGKTTLIEFIWKLYGREGYEGFDPSNATFAALSRNMARTANIPVVLMEGDREDGGAHTKKFDWNQLKTSYNGRPFRETGVKNGGTETNAPPFRASIWIEQNYPVVASPAIMERIISMNFTKEGWTADTKKAAEELEQWPIEDLSGTIIHIVRAEKDYMERFKAAHPKYELEFITGQKRVRNARIRKCAAQLHAGLDAMAPLLRIPQSLLAKVHDHINDLAVERDRSLEADHPVVAKFWEAFDYLAALHDAKDPNHILGKGLNLHRKDDTLIAVNLQAFEAACKHAGVSHPPVDDLKRFLQTSKSRKFVEAKTVNSSDYGHKHCWVFQTEDATKAAKPQKKGN